MSILLNGDCFEEMKTIDDKSVDCIIIDPPYEIKYNNLEWDKKELNWIFLREQFNRILKDNGNLVIFQGWSNVCKTKEILQETFILNNWIIYDRIKGRGAKKNVTSTREDILWFSKTKIYTFNKIDSTILKKTGGMGKKNGTDYRSLSNVWTDISPIVPWSKERVKHPTQKPIKIMDRIIRVFTNENDLILDCFMGSGTTIVSAKNLNRKYIGIELEKEYYDIAVNRIEE